MSKPDTPSAAKPARRLPEPRRPTANGSSRRLAILLAAEKLFGQRGYVSVSIRDIAQEAGVPLALVGYYWGSKAELYHAIFDSWRGLIDARLARLEQVMAEPQAPDALERVLEAFAAPVIAMHHDTEGQHFARMATRDLASPTPEADAAQREFFDPMAHRFIDALHRLFPARRRAEAAWCYQFALGVLLHFLCDERVQRLSQGENRPADPAQQGPLLRFIAAGCRELLGADTPARP